MALQADAIADLVASTQRNLGRFKFTEIASDLQDHVALRRIFKRKNRTLQGGEQIQFDVMTQHSGAAKHTGLYEVDSTNTVDVLQQGVVPWRWSNTFYQFDEREESLNASPERIVDLVQVRRAASMISWAELVEDTFWSKPTDSTDSETPFGVFYWLVDNATTGFNGGNPSGFAAGAAGLDSSTYTRWANFTGAYTDVTQDDLVATWREAFVKTKFRSPVQTPSFNTGDDYGLFTNYDVLGTLERLVAQQNENLGNDIASTDGTVTFRRIPVEYVPKLDSNTADPVIGINFGEFKTTFKSGWNGREKNRMTHPLSHNVLVSWMDWGYNWTCTNRRRNFLIQK